MYPSNTTPVIGWSDFALTQNSNYCIWAATPQQLIDYVLKNWAQRNPGVGRTDCSQVVVVPILENDALVHCRGRWIPIANARNFETHVVRRQPEEDPYLLTTAEGDPLPVTSLSVVLYSRNTLLENNGRVSGNFEWEIVAVLASSWKVEPMSPLTMARNFLERAGGTKVNYTNDQFAEGIYFWSGFVQKRSEGQNI